MRATPPSLRMSAGTRSSAMTAQAPASSAIRACEEEIQLAGDPRRRELSIRMNLLGGHDVHDDATLRRGITKRHLSTKHGRKRKGKCTLSI